MNDMTLPAGDAAALALENATSFIEQQMPVGRVSAEAYKERKAIHGQLLTSLGSYWKGRKPLILVRAAILGCLLPATDDPVTDLRIFLMLMGMDDASFRHRLKSVRPKDINPEWEQASELVELEPRPAWRKDISRDRRRELIIEWLLTLPYARRLAFCLRPEECEEELDEKTWDEVNRHLGTSASSLGELVRQLGKMRFGRVPRVADTFSGGGSIPFEAARIGCEAEASDLNPIACMLTWGAFNIIGAGEDSRSRIEQTQKEVSALVEAEIDALGIEKDPSGRRAKAYLYCVEALCPKTGYRVPLAPSWVISRNLRTVARLRARPETKDYEIQIVTDASDDDIRDAERAGTFINDSMVHPANPEREGVSMSVVRGDRRSATGERTNLLRRWDRSEFEAREDDIFRERLYCIQWTRGKGAPTETFPMVEDAEEEEASSTFFAAPTEHDLANETRVKSIVKEKLSEWQREGLGRVDEFDQAQSCGETDDRAIVSGGLFASEGDALEPLQAADALFDAGASLVERLGEEVGFLLLVRLMGDHRSDASCPCRLSVDLAGVALVADHGTWPDLGTEIEKSFEVAGVGGLSAGQVEADDVARRV